MTIPKEPSAERVGLSDVLKSPEGINYLTVKLRLRDKHARDLTRMAKAVNFVWNYCNETQQKAVRSHRKWLTNYDLQKLTSGSSRELGLMAQTITCVCKTYDKSRRNHKKPWLKWRGKKSLGWVPFRTGNITFNGSVFTFRGIKFEPMHMDSRLTPQTTLLEGSFNQDARGRWFLNVPIKAERAPVAVGQPIGIDLGLKSLAALSNGKTIATPRLYRASERKLAIAQRAKKLPKRIRNIHAKIANRRKDFLHKASVEIARKHGLIVVGDVSPSEIAKTKMAKSVHDAGWSEFRYMLSYKAIMHGGRYIVVPERMSTQTCSECGSLPLSRPRGIAGLGIREWTCDNCGAVHDRDVNAARNILRVGLDALAEGAAQERSSHEQKERGRRLPASAITDTNCGDI